MASKISLLLGRQSPFTSHLPFTFIIKTTAPLLSLMPMYHLRAPNVAYAGIPHLGSTTRTGP